jgi:hypothetical protein
MNRLTVLKYITAMATVFFLMGCSKDAFEIPEENAPVFEVHGTLGNEAFDLVAGDDDAYMHTSTKIHNGVRVFTGELSNSETSVELGIFDGNIDIPNATPEIDIANVILEFAQRPADPLTVLTVESITPNQAASSVEWYINGTFAGTGEVPIYEPGKYNICAFVTFAGSGQTRELCDEIILGYSRNANCTISYNASQGYVMADLNVTGDTVETVEWFLDGSSLGSGPYAQFQTVFGQVHKLTAHATFANGVVREKTCLIDGSNLSQTISDFTVFEISSTQSLVPQDYKVRMTIRNNGKTYHSVFAENEGSSITLLQLEQYEDNANGNSVYKAQLQIQAVVMEMSTEKMIPVNFITTLGIEIP